MATAEEYGLAMPIVQAARQVNYRQRVWVVDRLLAELKILKGRTIALLGLAFKPNTDDLRDAPALSIGQFLVQRGARVRAHDPVAVESAGRFYPDLGIDYCQDVMETVADADAVVLVTEWADYRELDWQAIREQVATPLLLDGRNFLNREKLEELGFRTFGVGR